MNQARAQIYSLSAVVEKPYVVHLKYNDREIILSGKLGYNQFGTSIVNAWINVDFPQGVLLADNQRVRVYYHEGYGAEEGPTFEAKHLQGDCEEIALSSDIGAKVLKVFSESFAKNITTSLPRKLQSHLTFHQ